MNININLIHNHFKKNLYESINEFYNNESIINIIIKNNRLLYIGIFLIFISIILFFLL